MVDGAALLLSASDYITDRETTDEMRGPALALANGMPTLVRIGRAAGLPIEPPVLLVDLLAASTGPAPSISIRRDEYMVALGALESVMVVPDADREGCWQRFAWMRSGYDLALRGLTGLTLPPPSPWSTDRPAVVGRPRLLRRRPIEVDWTIPELG
jgi:hypothetical protein